MNEVPQLAGAILAIAFAAAMLAAQLYIEKKSARLPAVPAALTASPWIREPTLLKGRRREPAPR